MLPCRVLSAISLSLESELTLDSVAQMVPVPGRNEK